MERYKKQDYLLWSIDVSLLLNSSNLSIYPCTNQTLFSHPPKEPHAPVESHSKVQTVQFLSN